MKSPSWVRVSPKDPCPVCGRCKGCRKSVDGGAATCVRVSSDRPAGACGWLHILAPRKAEYTAKTYTITPIPPAKYHDDEAEALHLAAIKQRGGTR